MSINTSNSDEIRDGYAEFFELCSKEEFFNFGLSKIISVEKAKAEEDWIELKNSIISKTDNIFIRDFGRNGVGNSYLKMMYKDLFDININFDPTNNTKPSQKIQKLSGYRKNKTIYNYQVSHIFGNTKNIYCFNASWNIVFIPKILDPFTGHEAKGEYVDEFKRRFQTKYYEYYHDLIKDYNGIIRNKKEEIVGWVEENIEDEKNKESILKEFVEIII
jgi:hypothetical protein